MASADVRPGPAHLGQGARKATCTLQRCRHVRTSLGVASHARAVASSLARGYWFFWSQRATPPKANFGGFTGWGGGDVNGITSLLRSNRKYFGFLRF